MSKSLSPIVEPLLNWFDQNKRELPWRRDKEPYHVWISEIMLQQTRIEAVMGYYARFLDALPDVESLSRVDDDALMKLWEGLGYYSRARNLKKAAVVITEEYGGEFPQAFIELKKLPGIGEYTAGAIASICFDEKVPAVDGNVLRVIARVQGSRDNVLLPQTKKSVTEQLRKIMPQRAGAFNEALMELGELVCLPNGAPLCESCPLQEHCTAFKKGLTEQIPVRVKKMKRRRADKSVFMITDPDGRIAIEKRPDFEMTDEACPCALPAIMRPEPERRLFADVCLKALIVLLRNPIFWYRLGIIGDKLEVCRIVSASVLGDVCVVAIHVHLTGNALASRHHRGVVMEEG